jgi:ligand-binding sensor domain-containing protein
LLRLLLLYAVISLVACSGPGEVAGTGSSTGNAKIGGIIKDKNDKYADNTIVYLIPEGYNPVNQLALPDNFIDTTNSCGRYSFHDHEMEETYNILAVRSIDNTQLFIGGILVDQDTVVVPTSRLKDPGNVTVVMSDTIAAGGGYIYIPGTKLFTKMGTGSEHIPGKYEIKLNTIPAAEYLSLYYSLDENPSYKLRLTDVFTVTSKETLLIGSYSFYNVYNTHNSGLPNDHIYSVAIDHDGSVWFGSDTGEIIHFDGSVWTVYNDKVYNSAPVLSVALEDDGNRWFGAHSGVAGLDGNTWSFYDEYSTPVFLNSVYSIAIDANGNKWFTRYPAYTQTGGIVSYNGSTWREYTYANSGMPSDHVYCIAIDENQNKWIGTGKGVARLNSYGNWRVYNTYNSGLPCDMIFSVGIDNNGDKWMGTYYGEAVRYDDSYWYIYDKWNSELTGATIHSIAFDSKGNRWFGTADGSLVKFDGTVWQRFNGSNSNIPYYAGPIYGLAVDKYDNIWVTTDGRGVVVFGSEEKIK